MGESVRVETRIGLAENELYRPYVFRIWKTKDVVG